MPRTLWCASCSCCFLINGTHVQTWNGILFQCTNNKSESSSRAEQGKAIGCRSLIYRFIVLHYGGNEFMKEFIHTSLWKARPPLLANLVPTATRMYCKACQWLKLFMRLLDHHQLLTCKILHYFIFIQNCKRISMKVFCFKRCLCVTSELLRRVLTIFLLSFDINRI